ncbi:MAG: hypothetical protein E4H44_07180 [Candidatus Aminicenantes bacterium]|nr:MAG: hypothetical protein E4H44_07180 [Candidatus Aminicenantes bacterium]
MNKSRLIWGIVCLALAVLLVALIFVLPANEFMFQVGDMNVPWLPAIILGVVGVVLLAGAGRGESETAQTEVQVQAGTVVSPEKTALNKRLESIAWGLFLIMLGGFAFVPNDQVPDGLWSIGVGLIFLGLNAARYSNQIRMSGFTSFLGIISVLGGIAELIWKLSIEGALLLIILGAYLVLKPWFEKRQLFGKAEQS